MKRILKRLAIMAVSFAAILFVALVLPAYMWAPVSPSWAPSWLRHWAYDMRLGIARPALTAASLYLALKGDFSVCRPGGVDMFTLLSGGLEISAALTGVDSNEDSRQPAVLIVHGSTPQGKGLSLYRLLMQKLAAKGYIVMSIDLRGFGQSDDPSALMDPKSFDFVEDVISAFLYLKGRPEIDPEKIFLVGHSFGGDVAISSVVRMEHTFKKVSLIGPGRRFLDRGGRPGAPEFEYFRHRDMRYMKLDGPIPVGIYVQYRTMLPIENHVGYLSNPGHAPILLIDCELEDRKDHQFLKSIYEDIRGEKAFYTVPGADHYLNSGSIGPVVFYDDRPMHLLINELDHFFTMPTTK